MSQANTSNITIADLFLANLDTVEGGLIPKQTQPLFQADIDEARYGFVRTAKRELDALHSIEAHQRRTSYGLAVSSWWAQETAGDASRFKVQLKDGTKVLDLGGRNYWMLPNREAACLFFAQAIAAAEAGHFDKHLTPKPKKKDKASAYSLYAKKLAAELRAGNKARAAEENANA